MGRGVIAKQPNNHAFTCVTSITVGFREAVRLGYDRGRCHTIAPAGPAGSPTKTGSVRRQPGHEAKNGSCLTLWSWQCTDGSPSHIGSGGGKCRILGNTTLAVLFPHDPSTKTFSPLSSSCGQGRQAVRLSSLDVAQLSGAVVLYLNWWRTSSSGNFGSCSI